MSINHHTKPPRFSNQSMSLSGQTLIVTTDTDRNHNSRTAVKTLYHFFFFNCFYLYHSLVTASTALITDNKHYRPHINKNTFTRCSINSFDEYHKQQYMKKVLSSEQAFYSIDGIRYTTKIVYF